MRLSPRAAVMTAACLLSACTGTGTRETSEINALVQIADGNTAIVARDTGFAGSAARISVLMNGTQVALLGNNEVDAFQAAPGRHDLSLDFEGIDIGLKTNTLVYNNEPARPQYFVVTLTQNFIGAELTISEVSPESFASALQ